MPDITGSELSKSLQRVRPETGVPYVSSSWSTTLAADARRSGPVRFLAEPLIASELALRVSATLDVPLADAGRA